MPVAIHDWDWVLFWGDSISGPDNNEGGYRWWAPPGGLRDQIVTLVRPTTTVAASATNPTGAQVTATNPVGAVASVIPVPGNIVTVANNQDGQTWGTLASTYVPSWISAMPAGAPTNPVVAWECGINDAKQIDGGTYNISQTIAGLASCVSQVQAVFPSARHVFLSCFSENEFWQQWSGQASIAAVDNAIQSQVAAIGASAVYIDNRDALYTWESVNNPTNLGGGVGTVDGTHPKINTMLAVMAVQFLATVAVGP